MSWVVVVGYDVVADMRAIWITSEYVCCRCCWCCVSEEDLFFSQLKATSEKKSALSSSHIRQLENIETLTD